MSEENRESGSKPVVVQPGPHSIEDVLRRLDPGADDETERFVAAIYEDRRRCAADSPRE
jgi:hypothetical protein